MFGFITSNEGLKVHKTDCPNAIQLQSNYTDKILKARWIDSSQEEFRADIHLTGIDNMGLISEITQEISKNLNVDMKKVSFSTDDGIFEGDISLRVKNNDILNKLISHLKKIDGIDKVTRQ